MLVCTVVVVSTVSYGRRGDDDERPAILPTEEI